MKDTTIVILIDALGWTLAERFGFNIPDVPYRARLRTVLGFSQAALASIFTGLEPDEHLLWMMYSFSRDQSPFGWLRLMPRSVSARRLWLRRLIRWHLRFAGGVRGYYSLYDVPREVLPHLDIPAKGDLFAPRGAGEASTIFDALDGEKAPFLVWDYRTAEDRAFAELEAAVLARKAAFYLLYTAGLDSDLHRYGTHDPRIQSHLAWYRDRIERVVSAARKAGNARIIVLGDHGMCDVNTRIDIMQPVAALGLEIPRDYIPFYDSTMARFRICSDAAGERLRSLLGNQPSGRLLDSAEIARLGISFPDGRFGDLIFLADPGAIISPSYMGGADIAAMHGYHPDAVDMSSVLLSNADVPGANLSLCDVAGLMLPGFTAVPRRDAE
jgi:hypothetical protein